MRSHVPAIQPAAKESSPLQRKPALRIGEHDDAYEREADRMADAVTSDSADTQGISLSRISIAPPVQRDGGAKKKSEEEKYTEALKKVGEAFLETAPGKEIKQKAEQLGDAFISTLPGKIIGGSAIAGAIATLAATSSELPVEIPEIPLDMIKPGLKLKLTYEGPVDKPTKVAATFSIPLGAPQKDKKPSPSESERFRAETARMAREQHAFREMLKTPQQRENEQALINAWVLSRQSLPGDPLLLGIGGGLPLPLAPYAPEYKISGEQPKSADPKKKKKKESAVQRKSNNGARAGGTPAIVGEVLESSGRPLEPSAREFMESRFGHDFSQVRVHTDERAARSAEAINASAYTAGNRIVFAHGQYSPATQRGRHLLAHELTHVLQQGGRPAAPRDTSVLRRKSNTPAPSVTPAEALKTALNGDDDSVRDLTASPLWGAVILTPRQAALLLIELLDGATLDEDENAGLKVLRKTLAQGILDDSLTSLWKKSYFNQLLDDYHGIEYDWLLELLSGNIDKLQVKALFLDAFIAMYWVKEAEEKAIVVLLERTVDNEQRQLLSVKDRQQQLRDAIDTNVLTIRYEKIASRVNELRQADLAAQLNKLFITISKDKKATSGRTPAETNRLLAAAARDLATELADYKWRLQKVLNTAEPDAGEISEINENFETRLKFLVERKQEEFKVELKYGVELNRLMYDIKKPGLSWNLDAIKKIDGILAKIPPEILRANPKFRAIDRGARHPGLSGQAPWSGEKFKVFGSLSLNTTAHELGHVISYDNGERLQKEFNKQFKWEELELADLTKLIPDRDERESLVEKMDEDQKEENESKGDRYAYGDHYYRMNRYKGKGSYLRHPKSSCFVSDYAATDRYDDFAESFEAYVVQPGTLFKTCPDRYRFMRKRVFTGYLYGKQVASALEKFDKHFEDGLKNLKLKGELPKEIKEKFFKTLRDGLEKTLETTGKELGKKALETEASDDMKRVPLSGKEALMAARPYRKRVAALFKLLRQVAKPWNTIFSSLVLFKVSGPKKFRTASQIIGTKLQEVFLKDILNLIQAAASRVVAGKKARTAKLAGQLQALVKQSQQAVKVAPDYRVDYDRLKSKQYEIKGAIYLSLEEKDVAGPTAWKYLKRVPEKHPGRQDFIDYINERRDELAEQFGSLRDDMIQQIKAGIRYRKSRLTTFSALVAAYEKDIKAYVKKKGLLPKKKKAASLQRKSNHGSHVDSIPAIVNKALDGPGQLIEPTVRTYMESRFGHDFSRVRIHSDATANRSAQAIHASAYTVGDNVVFGANQYRPHSQEGRGLLAHELTHVIQQGAARVSSGVPAGSPSDIAEHEAERLGEAAVQGDGLLRPKVSRPVSLMLQPADLQSIPLKERKAIQVSTMSVTVPGERIDAFFKLMPSGNPGEKRSVGATNSFSTNIPAALQTGLASVGAWIQGDTNALPLDSSIEVDLDLSSHGGAKSTYRFSYFTHSTGKGKSKKTSTIMLIELIGNVISAPVGQAAPANDFKIGSTGFGLAGKWSDGHYAVLRKGLSLLSTQALADAAGVTFRKVSGKSSSGEAGEYDQTSDTISLYSNAFPASSTRVGQYSVGVHNVLHEVGHALDLRVLARAWKTFNSAGQSESALKKFLKKRSLSGSRWVLDAKTGKYTDKQVMSDAKGKFRKAAQKDGVREDTGKRITTAGTTALLKGGITSYSDTDYQELFSESFALYMSAPETLRQLRPNIYGYFNKRYPKAATP